MRLLIVSAHPDDETVGCGGTILKHRERGDTVFWLVATRAHEPEWPAEVIRRKAEEVKAVAEAYRFAQLFRLDLPAAQLDTVPQAEIMREIRAVALDVRPDWVYLVHRGDVHSDHRVIFESTMAVFKPFHTELGVARVLCYECLSSTDAAPPLAERAFVPNVFSDITPFIDRKIEIMSLYRTEIHPDPMPRGPSAIRALARYRGATVGVEYAEAFVLMRELE